MSRRKSRGWRVFREVSAKADWLVDEVESAEAVQRALTAPPPWLPPHLEKLVREMSADVKETLAHSNEYRLAAGVLRTFGVIGLVLEKLRRPKPPFRRKTGRDLGLPPPAMADDDT